MKIAIIGLGYVGLPLGLRFAESDVSVLGLDVDPQKVDAINAGRSYIKHIEFSQIAAARHSGTLEASTDFSRVAEVDAVLICVPTPLDKHREPDISYVLKSGEAIAPYLGGTGHGAQGAGSDEDSSRSAQLQQASQEPEAKIKEQGAEVRSQRAVLGSMFLVLRFIRSRRPPPSFIIHPQSEARGQELSANPPHVTP